MKFTSGIALVALVGMAIASPAPSWAQKAKKPALKPAAPVKAVAPAKPAPKPVAPASVPAIVPSVAPAPVPAIVPPVAPKPDGTITNVFVATDILQALSDVAQAAGVTIIPDNTVQGTVTVDLKKVPLEKALTMILQGGGFAYAKVDDYYLVGLPEATNPNYFLLTSTEVVDLKYMAPNVVIGMLSGAYGRYLAAEGDAPLPPPSDTSATRTNTRLGGQPGMSQRMTGQGGGPSVASPQRYRIVVTAPPSMMARIKAEIAKVDVAPAQVMLEVQVIEVSDEALKEFGIDWATHWLQQDLAATGANLLYSNVAKTEMVSLKALINKGRARLRANPRIATVEGQTAELEVGKESYYAILTGSVAYQYATVEQITSGIVLRITPRVLKAEGEILARLEPEVRDVTGKGSNGLPEITTRRASTTLRVKDGQSIVIGGLVNELADHTESKIPLLGDLPLVGNLFRHGKTTKSRTEVVIVVTPHILTDLEVYTEPDSTKAL